MARITDILTEGKCGKSCALEHQCTNIRMIDHRILTPCISEVIMPNLRREAELTDIRMFIGNGPEENGLLWQIEVLSAEIRMGQHTLE